MIRARKRFAQHFLETAWVNKLIAASGIGPDDSVLEIGPGRGAITRPLAAVAKRLLVIEVDRDLLRVRSGSGADQQHEPWNRDAALHAISSPRIVPVDEANFSSSRPRRWSIETNRFGSG